MADGPKHRLKSKCMLAAIMVATLGLIVLCIVAAFGMPPLLRRGAAGSLHQHKAPPLLQ